MSPAPKKVDVSTVPLIKGLEVKSIELKPPEDEQEKTLRLHKERISFYIKDVVIWIFGVVCLVVIGSYCLWVLTGSSSAPAEKDWALGRDVNPCRDHRLCLR